MDVLIEMQVRGKKNLVISRSLTGPIGLFVKFSTLQEYGVEKVFVLENGNTDSSQRNIVYLVNGEKASQVQATAGMPLFHFLYNVSAPYRTFSLPGTYKEMTSIICSYSS